MWLGGDEQGEVLQRRRDVNLRVDDHAPAPLDLAEIVGAPLRRDRPQDVSGVDRTDFVGAREVFDFQLDARAAPARALHFGLAAQAR